MFKRKGRPKKIVEAEEETQELVVGSIVTCSDDDEPVEYSVIDINGDEVGIRNEEQEDYTVDISTLKLVSPDESEVEEKVEEEVEEEKEEEVKPKKKKLPKMPTPDSQSQQLTKNEILDVAIGQLSRTMELIRYAGSLR